MNESKSVHSYYIEHEWNVKMILLTGATFLYGPKIDRTLLSERPYWGTIALSFESLRIKETVTKKEG
jgi:hypothetical protein